MPPRPSGPRTSCIDPAGPQLLSSTDPTAREIAAPLFELARAYHELGHDRDEVPAFAEAGALRYDAWGEPARAGEMRKWSAEVRAKR